MKHVLLMVCALFVLAGCASQMTTIETTYDNAGKPLKTTELRSDYASYAAAIKPSTERPKLMDIECPPTGCNFTKFVVYEPSNPGASVQTAPPPEALSATIAKELFATLRGAIPYAAGMAVLNKAFEKANASVSTSTSIDNSNRSVTTNTSTTATASGPGAAAANGGAASGSAPTTTSTTTTTTSNSNNTTRTATGGNTNTGSGGPATTGP